MVEMTPQQRFRQRQGQLAETFGGQDVTPEGGIGLLTSVLGPARYGAGVVMPLLDDAYRAVRGLVTVGKGGKIVPTSKQVRQLAANELEAARMAARFAQPTAREALRRFGGPSVAAAGLLNANLDGPDPQIQNVTSPARIIPAHPGEKGTEVGVNMNLPPAPAQPSDATTAGLKLGNGVGDNNRERSFLERMAQSGLLSTLQGMARAERQYGVGPLAAFSESALDVQAARSAAQQKAAEAQLELDKEQIKAQPKPPKPSAEITKLYDRMRSNKNSLNFLNKIKQYMDKGVVTGGANAALNSIVNFAALFNINLGKTEGQKVDTLVKRLRAQLIASKAFGREANKQEIKLIEKIIPDAGIFTNVDQLREAYALLQEQAEGDARLVSGLLENVYGLPPYSQAVPDNIPAFTRPNKR